MNGSCSVLLCLLLLKGFSSTCKPYSFCFVNKHEPIDQVTKHYSRQEVSETIANQVHFSFISVIFQSNKEKRFMSGNPLQRYKNMEQTNRNTGHTEAMHLLLKTNKSMSQNNSKTLYISRQETMCCFSIRFDAYRLGY